MTELTEPPFPAAASRPDQASILLVDDNPANLLSLRVLLDDLGQNLVEARSGEEAIERVKVDEFAVILLDIMMPGISGFETAKVIRIQEQSRHTPIIFLTASDIDRPQMEEGYALGAVDFLVKPILSVALQAKVRGFVQLFQDKQRARHEADQLRMLVHGTTEYAIFMLDPNGRVVTWNAGAERIKQYKADEIIGQHFTKFYPQEAIDRGWPAHELKVTTTDGRFEDEGWRIRKDGTQFWANVVITALRDEHGELRGFSKVTRDLTERKRSEESLRRSEERFRLLIEGVQDYAIFMLDLHGTVISWNAGAEKIKQYRAEEIIGQHFSKFYPVEAINRDWPAHELKVAAAVGRFEDEGWRVRKDGSQFWANVVITALKDESNKLIGYSKITRDMTEQKQSEQTARLLVEEATARRVAEENAKLLQEQRERLQVTLASIGDGVISTDAEGRVGFLNPVAEELVGWMNEEALGRSLADVFQIVNEDTRQPVENPALRALKDGVIVGLANHTILISKEGTGRPIDDSAAPIRDAEGRIIGSVLVFRDISERKRGEVFLAQQKRVLELLVHGAPLSDVLDAVCEVVEGRAEDRVIATMLLADEDGKRLRSVAGRRAPAEYAQAVDGVAVGPCAGSCGTAAHRGEPVIVTDIASDPLWADYRSIALAHGLRACWSTPIMSSQGKVLGTFAVYYPTPRGPTEDERRLVDILTRTASVAIERKRAELALRESEQRFRQLANAMPHIVWTARPDGNIDYLNHRWTEFTGLPDTVGSEGWGQIVHPDDATSAGEKWAASVRSGTLFKMELRLLDQRSRTYRWHLIRTVPVHNEEGQITRWFGTGTDIQEQKQAEESSRYLAEASAALAGVVDYESTLQKMASLAVPQFADWSAVDVADNEGNLRRLAVSHRDSAKVALAHELMRTYPPDPEAPGGAVSVLKTGEPEIVSEITEEMLVQGAKDKHHLRLIQSLGLKSYICVPLLVSGNPFGVLTFATAESGRKYTDADLALAMDLAHRASVAIENTQLYQSLRDADRRKDEFLATLAHELRNPLAPIRNSLQILKMPRVDAATAQQTRDMMERQVHHLVRLVDDLLDVSRVMRGKIELRKERVEVSTVIARAVETAKPLIEVQSHKLDVAVTHESLLLDADPVRLAQVVGNLLTNSAKYSEPHGHIWLTARREGDEAVLSVRDSGIGIAPDMLPHVFELFVQADYASSKAQGGLGIGLTLVKNLVEMHNGSVQASSAGLGQGSEFTIRLPLLSLTSTPNEGELGEPDQAPLVSGHKLLVVDDNHDAAISLAMLLRLQGHEVRVAHDGVAALEVAAAFRPDVIFLDIGMPGMDGYEVARRIRKTPGLEMTILAALTGWGQQQDRRRTAEVGFNHHLVKPPEPKAVESVLEALRERP